MAKDVKAAKDAAVTEQTTAASADLGLPLLDTMVKSYTRTDKPAEDQAKRARDAIDAVVQEALNAEPNSVEAANVERTIKLWQSQLDAKISTQLDAVMHDKKFQQLEGTWRGINHLVKKSETSEYLQLRVFNANKNAILRDFQNAVESDQSALYKAVYRKEYDQLGGTPYGMLVGDFEFTPGSEDIYILNQMAGVAAASHAPFVAAAAPAMFELKDNFERLDHARDLAKTFTTPDYIDWRAFRKSPDSRYVALTLPRVLARLPYVPGENSVDEFRYVEDVTGHHDRYCWMNAAWAYAANVTNAFAKDGWFMRTRGVEGGGKVQDLPIHKFDEAGGRVAKCPTEVLIPDGRENELSNLGFLPLLYCKNDNYAAFLGAASCNKPEQYFDPGANANAELSAKLTYMMCVSRFAHYLKVIADAIGTMKEEFDMKQLLNNWIHRYVCDPASAGEEMRAKNPLSAANIEVESVPGKPGWYRAIAHLRPHFQFEGLNASMRLVAELPKKK